MAIKVADKWRTAWKKSGFEFSVSGKRGCKKLGKFPRAWKRIFKEIKTNPFSRNDLNIFEVGCGGGNQLIMFALNGWKCVGLDCSKEVLERAKNYIQEASVICKNNLDVTFICEDFLNYAPANDLKFDIVFHVGVLEHFLDESERLIFLKKMFGLAKPEGYVVSIVPSGVHPLRQKMRQLKLGGYDIPEIDYDAFLIEKEFKQCGAKEMKIFPHNILGYFLIDNKNLIISTFKRLVYYFFQIMPPFAMPPGFASKHASTLIGIAKKPI